MIFRTFLLGACLLAPGVANAAWQRAESKHFIVYSDDTPERARAEAARLERFDKALRVVFGVPEKPVTATSQVTVYFFGGMSDIEKLVGRSAAGFYQSQSLRGPIAFAAKNAQGEIGAMTILQHEYTHHFMFSNWPSAVFPTWFVEGFAEFAGTSTFRGDGTVTIGVIPRYREWGVGKAGTLPMRQLLTARGVFGDDFRTEVLYSRGWLLTHYLMFDKERSSQLAAYIVAINSGKNNDEAIKIFGDLNSLDLKLNNYARRMNFSALTLTPDQLPIGEVTVRAVSPGEAATMPARIRSNAGVDARRAADVVIEARQQAAAWPNDSAAQNELAEAEYDVASYATGEARSAHLAAASAAADRALAVDPGSIHALLYKGMIEQDLVERDKATDPARWQAVRRWYLAANKAGTEYPEPLVLYYRSFLAAHQKPSKNAENGLLYAYALAPYVLSVRMDAGRVLLEQGKVAEAIVAIEPIAYSTHGGEFAEFAAKVLAALKDKGAPAALEVIAEQERKEEKARQDAAAKGAS